MVLEFSGRIFENSSKISSESAPREGGGVLVVPCRRTDRHTDMTKLTVAFCNFVNVPKNCVLSYSACDSFAPTVSQLKICDFSIENFEGFELL